MNTYKLTLLALLAALGVIGRVVLSFIPNVQPITTIIIIAGIMIGPLGALLLALLTTFLSNMILGMGVWTIWQIVSWGIIGLISGLVGKVFRKVPFYITILLAAVSGYLYGMIISLTTYQITGLFWPYYLAGLPFDTNHAIGNVVFMILLYPTITHFFEKYAKDRFTLQNTNCN